MVQHKIYPLLAAIGVMSCIAATTIYVTLNKGDVRPPRSPFFSLRTRDEADLRNMCVV